MPDFFIYIIYPISALGISLEGINVRYKCLTLTNILSQEPLPEVPSTAEMASMWRHGPAAFSPRNP